METEKLDAIRGKVNSVRASQVMQEGSVHWNQLLLFSNYKIEMFVVNVIRIRVKVKIPDFLPSTLPSQSLSSGETTTNSLVCILLSPCCPI